MGKENDNILRKKPKIIKVDNLVDLMIVKTAVLFL